MEQEERNKGREKLYTSISDHKNKNTIAMERLCKKIWIRIGIHNITN